MPKQTLSLCMIVKNEEKFLEDCLKSVQGVADQIIIVDTGSTDRTVEIARSFNAQIHHFKWQDDFSLARNESIKYARGDWILWMDADERLMPESAAEFKKLLRPEKKAVAYLTQIHSLQSDGRNYKISGAHRLFNNHKGIRFRGRIHEQIIYSVAELKGEERESHIKFLHFGYGLQPAARDKKNRRNRKLLEQMVRDEPNNAYAHFTLAQHYGMTGEQNKALKHYKIAYKLHSFEKQMQASLLNTMAEAELLLKKYDSALAHCRQSVKLIPEQVGAYYMQYRIALAQNKTADELAALLEMEKHNLYLRERTKNLSTDILFDPEILHVEIAALYVKNGHTQAALSRLSRLSDEERRKNDIRKKMLEMASQSGDFEFMENVLQLIPGADDPLFLDMQGMVYIKQMKFTEAVSVYEKLQRLLPQNQQILKRLAGLYAKTGRDQDYLRIQSSIRL